MNSYPIWHPGGSCGDKWRLPAKRTVSLGCPRAHFRLIDVGLEKMLIFFFFFEHWRQRAIWVAMQPAPVPS